MHSALVSIMMPAYNAERYIAEAIESVCTQTYSNWELLVVNDGSEDDTAQIVAQFTDPRIKLIHKENGGESSARNMALEHMGGELVAFLDADDLYLPHHLEVSTNYLHSHPDRDGVYTDGYHCDQNGTRLKSLSSRRRGPFEGRVFEEVVRASDVFGPPVCVVLRYGLIARFNLRFDTNIVIGPDWDFFTRYSDLAQFGYIDVHTCLYRVHQTNISVQVDLQRRAGYLAICREKAIKMENFKTCSLKTRTAVFYDLLINLLTGRPERQTTVTHWPEFTDLPAAEQAHLYRLMASKALLNGGNHPYISEWLRLSRKLNPADRKGTSLSALYNVSPRLCQLLLRAKTLVQSRDPQASPFWDIE
jgi:glycosyltransferase involved in cell wall biosynthesis